MLPFRLVLLRRRPKTDWEMRPCWKPRCPLASPTRAAGGRRRFAAVHRGRIRSSRTCETPAFRSNLAHGPSQSGLARAKQRITRAFSRRRHSVAPLHALDSFELFCHSRAPHRIKFNDHLVINVLAKFLFTFGRSHLHDAYCIAEHANRPEFSIAAPPKAQ